MTKPKSGEVICLSDGRARPPLGTYGIHDRYHLSYAEKLQLKSEVMDYMRSRFGGEPCPSCFSDVLIAALGDVVEKVLADPILNSGTAKDFAIRTHDWAAVLKHKNRQFEAASLEAYHYERENGRFRNGQPTPSGGRK